MERRKFSREFKLEAVKLVVERGVGFAQAARDLDLHVNVLRKWVREQATDPQQAFPGKGQMKPEQLEIERLRKEVARLKAERDILKKAAASLSTGRLLRRHAQQNADAPVAYFVTAIYAVPSGSNRTPEAASPARSTVARLASTAPQMPAPASPMLRSRSPGSSATGDPAEPAPPDPHS